VVRRCLNYSDSCVEIGVFKSYPEALNSAIREVGGVRKVLGNGTGSFCVDEHCLDMILVKCIEV